MCDYSCDVYISDSVKLYTFLPFLQFSTMVTWGCAYPAQITPMIVQITPMPKRPLPDLFSALSFRIFFCSSIICSSVYPVYFLLAISVYMCYLLSMFFESPDLTFGSSYFYRNCFFPKLSLLFLLFFFCFLQISALVPPILLPCCLWCLSLICFYLHLFHNKAHAVVSSSVSHNEVNGCSPSLLWFFFRFLIYTLILMIVLTVSTLHCSMYFFLSHLSSLIVVDFVLFLISYHSFFLDFPLISFSIH